MTFKVLGPLPSLVVLLMSTMTTHVHGDSLFGKDLRQQTVRYENGPDGVRQVHQEQSEVHISLLSLLLDSTANMEQQMHNVNSDPDAVGAKGPGGPDGSEVPSGLQMEPMGQAAPPLNGPPASGPSNVAPNSGSPKVRDVHQKQNVYKFSII